MNQQSWVALFGQCATPRAAPPLHCLSPSLNPTSGTEEKGLITQTGLLTSQSIYFLSVQDVQVNGLAPHRPFPCRGK